MARAIKIGDPHIPYLLFLYAESMFLGTAVFFRKFSSRQVPFLSERILTLQRKIEKMSF